MVGIMVLVLLVCIRYTGTSVNPARSIGPAIFAGGAALSQLWIFIVAPLIGAALSAIVWKCITCECKCCNKKIIASMKRYMFFVVLTAVLSACRNDVTYSISGNADGADKVYLLDAQRNVIDSVEVHDGAFFLERSFFEPQRCYVSDNRDIQAAQYAAFLFVEQGDITIESDEEGLYAAGTPSNDAFHELIKVQVSLENEYYADSTTEERRNQIDEEYDASIQNAVEQNMDNLFGLYEFSNLMYDLDGEASMAYLTGFSEEMQTTDLWQSMMQSAQDKMRVDIGNPYIDFSQNAPDGTEISLKSVVETEGNRYVLLDFWASWCGPCMGEVPYLVKDYAKYHSKGFEIFGSSLDRSESNWLDAIEDNGMEWIHVSDLKYWDNSGAALYAVRSIPANFLIDCSTGMIVARNLRGDSLGSKLSELLDGVAVTAL